MFEEHYDPCIDAPSIVTVKPHGKKWIVEIDGVRQGIAYPKPAAIAMAHLVANGRVIRIYRRDGSIEG